MTDDAAIERAREEREEEAYERETIAADVPDIRLPFVGVKSAVVRDWVRAALVPKAITRLYEIGMGVTRFDVPTMAGNTVRVEAPAAVQRAALRDVIAVGVPPQVGLASDDDALPGVLALGEYELAAARDEVHTDTPSLPHGVTIAESEPDERGIVRGTIAGKLADLLNAYRYVPPDGHEVVVVEEAEATADGRATEPPPPVDPQRNALAQAILARHRARMRDSAKAGPRAGEHPQHE